MFNLLFNDAIDAINSWGPKKFSKEINYRDDLIKHLRKKFNSGFSSKNYTIIPEHGRGLCDIAINSKVGIELKKDFKTKSQADRLVGQISQYLNAYEDVIILLVGDTKENNVDYLKTGLSSLVNKFSYNSQNIRIINKGESKSRNNDEQIRYGKDPFNIKLW